MLKQLYIKNYALIDELRVNFHSGLNIITGETGAGKSIIIGALSMLLGEKASAELVRSGAGKAIVEGIYSIEKPKLLANLVDDEFDDGHDIILRREINSSGRSRCFINDSPVTNSQMTLAGDLLVDLHGQHAHQSLLKIDQHLFYLDSFGVSQELLSTVKDSYKKYKEIKKSLDELIQSSLDNKERQDLLEFQVQEIDQVSPIPGEEEELIKEEKLLRNSEAFFRISHELSESLSDGTGAATERLAQAETSLSALIDIEPQAEEWIASCESARIAVEETINALQNYVSKIDFNPEKMEQIRIRLSELTHLKKKYGGSIEQVFAYWEQAKADLHSIKNHDGRLRELEAFLDEEIQWLKSHTLKLSEQRAKVAHNLEKATEPILHELGLNNGKILINHRIKENPNGPFKVGEKTVQIGSKGFDHIEFQVSLNPGEEPKPLIKVASGGEISRIMLALKTVLARADRVPVLIFDEIDTGISGRIAQVVGKKLKELSRNHQIIAITHLPLIASMGDNHFKVEKQVQNQRSITLLNELDQNERVAEIAKLIGGDTITDSAEQSARELLSVQE